MVNEKVKSIIKAALREDIGKKDITTSWIVPVSFEGEAVVLCKEPCILCGIDVIGEIFLCQDKTLIFNPFKKDGSPVKTGEKVAIVKGKLRSILTAERVAMNFLALLSGISTATKKMVSEIVNTNVKIMDTRKTTPNLRCLEKYAVRTGEGFNHRHSLNEGIIVKDNHLRAAKCITKGCIDEKKIENVLRSLRKKTALAIEIEVETLKEYKEVIKYKPDVIMLDNFPVKLLNEAVRYRNQYFPDVKLEVSGGVNEKNVRRIARSGVDFISAGSLTHSPKAIDFSLEILDT